MATNLPDITARVRLDTTDLEQGVKRASKAGAGIGAALGTFAGQGVAAGLSSLKSFATGAVDAFAAIEDATSAAGVTFGDFKPDVIAFAEEAARNFGLSKRAAIDAANTYGTFGKAAGLSGEDLANFSTKLTGLAGDLASFKGTSTEQAVQAIGGALRGEAEPIRAYGVLLDEAALKASAMSIGLVKASKDSDKIKAAHVAANGALTAYNEAVKKHGKNSQQAQEADVRLAKAQATLKKATEGTILPLTSAQKILAAEAAIYKQTTDAQGDYRNTSKSTANVQKTLAAETENAQAALGAKLAPTVTLLRTALLAAIRASTGLFNVLNTLARVFQAIARFIKNNAVGLGLLTAALAIANAQFLIMTVRTNAQVAAFLIHNAVTKGVTAVTRGFAAAQVALNVAMTANPIGLIIAAIVGLIAVVVLAYKHSETFRKIVDAAFRAVKKAAEFAFNWIRDHWKLLLGIITGPIGLAVVAVSKYGDTIVGIFKAIPGKIRDAFKGLFNIIVKPLQDALNAAIKIYNNTVGKIPGVDSINSVNLTFDSGTSEGSPGATRVAGGGRIGESSDLQRASLVIQGDVVLNGHEASPDPESLVRGLRSLAFQMGS